MLIFTVIILILLSFFMMAHRNTRKVVFNRINLTNTIPTHTHYYPLNVLQISDMHLERISITPDQLFHILEGEKIDIIALTGDYLDKKRSIPKLIPYLRVLHKLKPTYGIYAVLGNHDYKLDETDLKTLIKTLEENGCNVLQNKHETILFKGIPMNIIGIDDHYTQKSDIQKSFNGVASGYQIVLTHDPSIVLEMSEVSFDYLLSGHFHGGQIHWHKPFHLAKMSREMVELNMIKGLHYYNGKPIYISEGLGQTSINIRVGSRPEVTLHTLPVYGDVRRKNNEKTLTTS